MKQKRNLLIGKTAKTVTLSSGLLLLYACGGGNIPPSHTQTQTMTIIHNGFTYITLTSPYTGKIWLDRNLGAAQNCDQSQFDNACYGDYYQWGRNTDGHEDILSTTDKTPLPSIDTVSNLYIAHTDWLPDSNTNGIDLYGQARSLLWNKTNGSNVCPKDFRVPSIQELEAETSDSTISFETSFLKIPSIGYRDFSTGEKIANNPQTQQGHLWSSSPVNNDYGSYYRYEHQGYISTLYDFRGNARPIRCIKN